MSTHSESEPTETSSPAAEEGAHLPQTVTRTTPRAVMSGDPTQPVASSATPSDVADPVYEVGQRIGPYVLEEKLGEGGMGTVWKAKQAKLNDVQLSFEFTALAGTRGGEFSGATRIDMVGGLLRGTQNRFGGFRDGARQTHGLDAVVRSR